MSLLSDAESIALAPLNKATSFVCFGIDFKCRLPGLGSLWTYTTDTDTTKEHSDSALQIAFFFFKYFSAQVENRNSSVYPIFFLILQATGMPLQYGGLGTPGLQRPPSCTI